MTSFTLLLSSANTAVILSTRLCRTRAHAPVLIRRRQRSSATVQRFCFTFNQRRVGPGSYRLEQARFRLGDQPLVVVRDHLGPHLETVLGGPAHGRHELAASDDVV